MLQSMNQKWVPALFLILALSVLQVQAVTVTCPDNSTITVNFTCPAGFISVGTTCDPLNACATNNGGCGDHLCILLLNGASMCGGCPPGTAEPNCTAINACASNNGGCELITTCFPQSGGNATCGGCPTGYIGNGRTGCQDVNECAANNGGCHDFCINIQGGRVCSECPEGFIVSGPRCIDINECATLNGGCYPGVTCFNRPGSYECGTCPFRYNGNGKNCTFVGGVLINETCVFLGCLNGGRCLPTMICNCTSGFNGTFCENSIDGMSGTGFGFQDSGGGDEGNGVDGASVGYGVLAGAGGMLAAVAVYGALNKKKPEGAPTTPRLPEISTPAVIERPVTPSPSFSPLVSPASVPISPVLPIPTPTPVPVASLAPASPAAPAASSSSRPSRPVIPAIPRTPPPPVRRSSGTKSSLPLAPIGRPDW